MGKEWNEFLSAKALDDGVLEQVSGGTRARGTGGGAGRNGSSAIRIACCKCQRTFPADISKDSINCPYCGEPNKFDG